MANGVNGITAVGFDKEDKHLSELWKIEKNCILSQKIYIKKVQRLETMVEHEFAGFDTPMSEALHPEVDNNPLLDAERYSQYRSLVGSANWLVTLGCFDVAYSTNIIIRFAMQPREPNLKGMIRVFGYLKQYYRG